MSRPQPQTEGWRNLPLELQDEGEVRYARTVTTIIIAVLSGLLVWAAVVPIDEAAMASGQIVPAAPISDVTHLEGGIVDGVFVKEGDRVKQGQVLVTLRPEQTASEFSQIEHRLAGFQLKSIRLTAALSENTPDFGPLGERFPKLRNEQKLAFTQDVAHAREERQQLRTAVERTQAQFASAEEEVKSLAVQVELQSRLTAIRLKSKELGYTSLPVVLQAQAGLEESKQRLIAGKGRVAELTRMLEESRTKLREAITERLRKLAEDLADTGAQISETQAALQKYDDRMRRLEVIAPIDGVVQTLASDVSGEVVKPGAMVAQIIPGASGVVAVVEMEPREAGHVRPGNDADIRLSNYDSNVVGAVTGKVQSISPTTFETKEGRPFYRVRIALNRDHVSAGATEFPILPGITLQAQIKTGSKSLLRYMLKPIYQSLSTAFAER